MFAGNAAEQMRREGMNVLMEGRIIVIIIIITIIVVVVVVIIVIIAVIIIISRPGADPEPRPHAAPLRAHAGA